MWSNIVRVADAVAAARLRDQVRRVGHALHAAGDDDVGAAGQQHVVREASSPACRAAHLRQRDGAGRQRQAGLERAWRAGAWPWPAIRQLPNSTSFDRVAGRRRRARPRPDRDRAEVAGRQRGKIALEAAHRRAGGADDNDWIVHVAVLH